MVILHHYPPRDPPSMDRADIIRRLMVSVSPLPARFSAIYLLSCHSPSRQLLTCSPRFVVGPVLIVSESHQCSLFYHISSILQFSSSILTCSPILVLPPEPLHFLNSLVSRSARYPDLPSPEPIFWVLYSTYPELYLSRLEVSQSNISCPGGY